MVEGKSKIGLEARIARMDPKLKGSHVIAIDGTLYEKYPRFRRSIIDALREIHGDDGAKIELTQAKDGSGIGVAIVAAVATHSER